MSSQGLVRVKEAGAGGEWKYNVQGILCTPLLGNVPPATTTYVAPYGRDYNAVERSLLFPIAGTLKLMYINVTENTLDAGTVTVTLMQNTNPTTITKSFAAGATGVFSDIVNTVAVAANDRMDFKVVTQGTSGSVTFVISIVFLSSTAGANTTKTYSILLYSNSNGTSINPGLTRYAHPFGGYGWSTSEFQVPIPIACTLKKLYVSLLANTLNGNTTIRTRIGLPAANGNQVVTIPASSVLTQVDLVNTDVVTAGKTLSFSIVTGGAAGSITPNEIAVIAED